MSGKVKMRCARCHKPFKSSGAKETLCPDCALKERAARAAAKAAPAKAPTHPTPTVQSLRITGPGATILDPTRPQPPTTATSVAPPDTGLFGAAARQQERLERQQRHEQQHAHEHAGREGHTPRPMAPQSQSAVAAHSAQHAGTPAPKPRPSRPQRDAHAQPARPPRTQRSMPPAPVLTDALRAQIEARYLELAQPVEFDGIRTQIATELNTPKSLVKRAVADLRKRTQTPSWWELRSYDGSAEQLERIRAAYTPLLPTPPIGVHKQLAATLGIDPRLVYQGIRRIRAELHLPQYNAPETHGQDAQQTKQAGEIANSTQQAQHTQQTMMEVG